MLMPRPFRVERVQAEMRDTWTLELVQESGGAVEFRPGQFTMIYAFGVGEVPISISGDPARPQTLVHTIRAVGATTTAICAATPGTVLGVRGPFGNAWPVEDCVGKDLVIVAGGIGLAPLRPAILAILAARPRFGRVSVLVGARTPADVLYAQELEHWATVSDLDVRVTVDTALGAWDGDIGVVTSLIERVAFDAARTAAFVCGPEIMIRFSAAELLRRGVPPTSLYVSIERNMKCAVGVCGRCQFGPTFVCKDGPVFPWSKVGPLLAIREL